MTLKTVSYEEARLDYFKKQKVKAKRSMNYWVNRSAKATCYLDKEYDKICEAADQVSFYSDVIKMLEEGLNDQSP